MVAASIWVVGNLRAPNPAIPLLIVLWLLGIGLITGLSFTLLLCALVVAVLLLLFGSNKTRKRVLTKPLLTQFRRVLPAMSDTEAEALNAGTVWWEGELFKGRPQWSKLLKVTSPRLSAEEQEFLDGPVETLCIMLNDWHITYEAKDLPETVWQFIRGHGFFGLIIPKRYGGLEFSAHAHSCVVMKLASRSLVAAVTVMVPNSLGPAKLLLHYGSDHQKNYYLPRLARGDEIPCFALTGPQAGSDAGAVPDRGIVCYQRFQGEETLGVLLNWEKRYITLGPVATVIGLAFRLEDPEGLLGEAIKPGITLALIPRGTQGISIGKRHITLDVPFQNGPISGKDVFIPLEWILGEQQGIGNGWRMIVECLAEGRGISLPALAVGAAKLVSRYTGAYARIRRQFHKPVGRFEGVEEALARIAGLTYQMDAARLLTLAALDTGENPSVISAIVKYHLTERYRQLINDAMDIQGGSGICLGPLNLIGRAYQAVPISITVEGANILTRSMIIFGQGAIRCHPYILDELHAASEKNEETALNAFDRVLFRHGAYILGNMAQSLLLGLSRGRLSRSPVRGLTKTYFRHLNWMSSSFALCADITMITLGGSLKRKERLSARLGDVLSELYIMSAVLKKFRDDGEQPEDLPLLRWACDDSLYRIQEALRSLFRNLPFGPLGWLMRLLVFPSGFPYHQPCDAVGHDAAAVLLSNSSARERLTRGVFLSHGEGERSGQLERALNLVDAAEQIEAVLQEALKSGLITGKSLETRLDQAVAGRLITPAEREVLESMECLRREVITVDSFAAYGETQKDFPWHSARRQDIERGL
ncbi:MAG: acyl-CoA dehydrogenase [Gammaproteobacteria bacterium]|nr:acyl-CoA dehydrogenase [Gammaproteobacteria bacterium]